MDFVILTSSESHDGSAQQVADEYYDQGGFGLDEENSGILYYIDMDDRYHYLSTTGVMQDYLTDARIENAIDEVTRYLSAGAYAQGASQMISIVRQYIRDGIPEGQYRYDVVTGQRLTARAQGADQKRDPSGTGHRPCGVPDLRGLRQVPLQPEGQHLPLFLSG